MRSNGIILLLAGIGTLAANGSAAASPFATGVISFEPAPGQFVLDPLFNDPVEALGAPVGGGTLQPNNGSVVSLGGFGGFVVLGFDERVMDDAANPFGLDCIVFGNASFVQGLAYRRWGEAGVIEISRDDNNNGLADDTWYLIPGSHIDPSQAQLTSQTWDDATADATYPPPDAAWLPPGQAGMWTTSAYELPPDPFANLVVEHPLGPSAMAEITFGYADMTPTLLLGDTNGDNVVDAPNALAEWFYSRPDDPMTVGITLGSGGGDAFDIAWAIDPQTGQPANIDGFDFIRISNGVNALASIFGEKSPEIDAVADASSGQLGDVDGDGDIHRDDTAYLLDCLLGPSAPAPSVPCTVVDFDQDGDVDLADVVAMQEVFGWTR